MDRLFYSLNIFPRRIDADKDFMQSIKDKYEVE